MQISARNSLKGIIKSIEPGAVNTEVLIELPGGDVLVSIVTRHSVERLKLSVGQTAYAIVKSSDVMIGVDN